MSLRSRLTLLYSTLIGAVLLIFGILVYGLVNVLLLDQIDQRLSDTADRIITIMKISPGNVVETRNLAELTLEDNQFFQVWQNANELVFSRPFGYNQPLDQVGLQQGKTLFRNSTRDGDRTRVLSVPLETSRGPAGVLQVGFDLSLIDITLQTLLLVLAVILVLAVLLAAISTLFLTRQALTPLSNMTEVAQQITETSNFSRRIPLPQENQNDEVFQLINSFNDTLARLDQILTAQKRLMADVSHDLRTPLTVIKGEIGLLRKINQVDEETFKSINSEVDRLTRLVGNLLLITQADTGDLPMDFSTFQVDELICEVYQHMQTLAGDNLNVCLENIEPLLIFADRDRIKQVMLNLIGNAIQYTPVGGKVCLNLEKVEDCVEISISDSGPGIAKEDLNHIFDRFYRGERSRSRSRNSGFGLGLSISNYIVNQHHGTISVHSDPGEGTRFTVSIPINAGSGVC